MPKNKIPFIIILLALVVGIFLLKNNDNPSAFTEVTPKPTTISEPTTTAGEIKETKEFEMIAKKWSFEPSTITVKKGTLVKLSIKSIDVDHGLLLKEFNINQELKPNQTVVVEFLADKTGTFSFSCNVFCGSGHGSMIGKLIVE